MTDESPEQQRPSPEERRAAEVDAHMSRCLAVFPSDSGTPSSVEKEDGRVIRDWTSGGRRVQAVMRLNWNTGRMDVVSCEPEAQAPQDEPKP